MGQYDDLVEQVREYDEDLADKLTGFSGANIRKQLAEAETKAKRVDELEAELEGLKAAPKREEAFKDFGVDLENLSKLERKALEAYDGELDREAIAAFVEENELPLVESQEGETEAEERSDAELVAQAARTSPQGRTRGAVITPEDAAEWPTQKLMEFRAKHPEEFEALKEGQTVTGVTA